MDGDRQTDEQRDRQTDGWRQTNRRTERKTNRWMERQTNRRMKTDKQRDRHTDGWTDRQTDGFAMANTVLATCCENNVWLLASINVSERNRWSIPVCQAPLSTYCSTQSQLLSTWLVDQQQQRLTEGECAQEREADNSSVVTSHQLVISLPSPSPRPSSCSSPNTP